MITKHYDEQLLELTLAINMIYIIFLFNGYIYIILKMIRYNIFISMYIYLRALYTI